MSGFSWTVPPIVTGTASQERDIVNEKIFGADYWLVADEQMELKRVVSKSGDWSVAVDREALRQALLRRLVTEPGEWATLPDYGVGVESFLRKPDSQVNRNALARRIRDQFVAEPRVSKVSDVSIERAENYVKLLVLVQPKGRREFETVEFNGRAA